MTGTVGLYLTDSLYEPEEEAPPPRRGRAEEGVRLRRPLEPPPPDAFGDDSDDELQPLTASVRWAAPMPPRRACEALRSCCASPQGSL